MFVCQLDAPERKNKLPYLLLILALFCFAGSAKVVCKDSTAGGDTDTEAQAPNSKCFPSIRNVAGEAVDREATTSGTITDSYEDEESGATNRNNGKTQ